MIDNQPASETATAPPSNTCIGKVVHCGEGEAMTVFGERVRVMLSGLDTQGQFALHSLFALPQGFRQLSAQQFQSEQSKALMQKMMQEAGADDNKQDDPTATETGDEE